VHGLKNMFMRCVNARPKVREKAVEVAEGVLRNTSEKEYKGWTVIKYPTAVFTLDFSIFYITSTRTLCQEIYHQISEGTAHTREQLVDDTHRRLPPLHSFPSPFR
jgi:hypothetical protein